MNMTDSKIDMADGEMNMAARSTHEDIRHVVGMSLLRNGSPVATITQFTKAQIEAGVSLGDDVTVSGDISKTSGQLG